MSLPVEYACMPMCIECVWRTNGCDGYSPEVDCKQGHELFRLKAEEATANDK